MAGKDLQGRAFAHCCGPNDHSPFLGREGPHNLDYLNSALLQLEYPGVSEAIIKDYKLIETQMEVEILDSNEENQGFVSNVQERIIVQETVLARGRAEHTEQITRAPH